MSIEETAPMQPTPRSTGERGVPGCPAWQVGGSCPAVKALEAKVDAVALKVATLDRKVDSVVEKVDSVAESQDKLLGELLEEMRSRRTLTEKAISGLTSVCQTAMETGTVKYLVLGAVALAALGAGVTQISSDWLGITIGSASEAADTGQVLPEGQ